MNIGCPYCRIKRRMIVKKLVLAIIQYVSSFIELRDACAMTGYLLGLCSSVYYDSRSAIFNPLRSSGWMFFFHIFFRRFKRAFIGNESIEKPCA